MCSVARLGTNLHMEWQWKFVIAPEEQNDKDVDVSCNQLTNWLTCYRVRKPSLKKKKCFMAHVIQLSLHLYALFIEVVCVFVDISSSTPYDPRIYVCITLGFATEIMCACLISVNFRDWNYVCLSHFRDILLLKLCMLSFISVKFRNRNYVCLYHFREIFLLKLSSIVSYFPNLYMASPSSPTDLITLVSSIE